MTGAGSLPNNLAQNTLTGSADLPKANSGFEEAVSPPARFRICLFPAQKPVAKTTIATAAIAARLEESQLKPRLPLGVCRPSLSTFCPGNGVATEKVPSSWDGGPWLKSATGTVAPS